MGASMPDNEQASRHSLHAVRVLPMTVEQPPTTTTYGTPGTPDALKPKRILRECIAFCVLSNLHHLAVANNR